MARQVQCKWCGKNIMWIGRTAFEHNTDPHKCEKPSVRKYTKEEIEKMNRERGFTTKGKK